MPILRVDSWIVKPGRLADVQRGGREVKPLIRAHGGRSPRLMRIAIGGTSNGAVYGEFEVDNLEELGRVTAGLAVDERAQQLLAGDDGPNESRQMLLVEVIADVGVRTESVEGCVESIQDFKVPPGRHADFVELVGELARFTDPYESRLRVLKGLTDPRTGDLSIVAEFTGLGDYGRFANEVWPQPAFQDLQGRFRELGQYIGGSLHTEIVV